MCVASPRFAAALLIAALPILVAACGAESLQGGFLIGSVNVSSSGAAARKGATSGPIKATGAVIGGINESEAGRQMSDRERLIAANSEYRALEYGRSGAPTAWDYPDTRHRGTIVPGRPYQKGTQYCRTYAHTIYGSGAPATVKGIACRDPNGTWRGAS
jgi:surface antigen